MASKTSTRQAENIITACGGTQSIGLNTVKLTDTIAEALDQAFRDGWEANDLDKRLKQIFGDRKGPQET